MKVQQQTKFDIIILSEGMIVNRYDKNIKKIVVIISLIIYSLFNFVNFSRATICIAENHIGLKFFGMYDCCTEYKIYTEEVSHGSISEHKTGKECKDKHLTTNSHERVPDDAYNIEKTCYSSDYELLNFMQRNKRVTDRDRKELKCNKIPNNSILTAYKTVRLTV